MSSPNINPLPRLIIHDHHIPLFFLLCTLLITTPQAATEPRGYRIDCGASNETEVGNLRWMPDDGFINVGTKTSLSIPNLMGTLATLRYFPDTSSTKYCYEFPVLRDCRYLVRTTYYYGNFDGRGEPPVFDQIVDGTKWSTVNTTVDYSKGLLTYYEIILTTTTKEMSICLARNSQTASGSNPFISALEVEYLDDSLYNSTSFDTQALSTIARNSFGYSGDVTSFPDDPFNRYWLPFRDSNPAITSVSNIDVSGFWNRPPAKVFQTALSTNLPTDTLKLQWPTENLPSGNYYIALYFADNRAPGPNHWRVFSVSINGKSFYTNLNVTTAGVMVYATHWPLQGETTIELTPAAGSTLPPLINAGEVFLIKDLGGRTVTRDVSAIEEVGRSLVNPPPDWKGDPCLPQGNAWTGIQCTTDKHIRIASLDLTNHGLKGSLSPSIANLTALKTIWLGSNKLTGTIPNLSQLKQLASLHLENNQLTGHVPSSLGQLPSLEELFLQNNNLGGEFPDSLRRKFNLKIQITPGNNITGYP